MIEFLAKNKIKISKQQDKVKVLSKEKKSKKIIFVEIVENQILNL
jgi:hypothetical protein